MTTLKKPATYSRPTFAIDYVPAETQDGVFLGSAAFDAAVRLNVVLLADAWAGTRRLKIVNSLVAKNIMPTSAKVEAYVPTAEEDKAWATERDKLIREKLNPLIEVARVSPSFPAPKHT